MNDYDDGQAQYEAERYEAEQQQMESDSAEAEVLIEISSAPLDQAAFEDKVAAYIRRKSQSMLQAEKVNFKTPALVNEFTDKEKYSGICASCGQPFKYFFQTINCESCRQKNFEKVEEEDKKREHWDRVERFYRVAPIQIREFNKDHEKVKLYRHKMREAYGHDFLERPGLVLHGDTGKMKTTTAWLIIKRMAINDGVQFAAYDVGFPDTVGSKFAEGAVIGENFMLHCCNVPLLFLDDFGKRWSDTFEPRILRIIDQRAMHRRWTIITTNNTSESLFDKITNKEDVGKPLVRRLKESYKTVNF